ncbi:Protein of unknown function [Gryllus bimaculatus]|nr:Protein of unknown function [Gryllus bimaculatus]
MAKILSMFLRHHLPRQKDPVYDPIEAKRKQQEDLVKIYKPRRVPAIRFKTEETSKKLRTKAIISVCKISFAISSVETEKMSARGKATVLPPLQREKPLDQKNVLAWKAGRRTKADALAETLPACLGSKHLRPQLLK